MDLAHRERDSQANQLSGVGVGGTGGFMKKVTMEEPAQGQRVGEEHTRALNPLPGAASNNTTVTSSGRNLFWRPGFQNLSVGQGHALSEVSRGDSVPFSRFMVFPEILGI